MYQESIRPDAGPEGQQLAWLASACALPHHACKPHDPPPPPLPRTWLLLCYWHRYRLSAKDALTHPWVTQKSRMHEGEDAAHVLDKHNEIVQALQHFATMGNHKKLALEVRFSRGRKPQQVGDGGRGGCWSRSRAPSFGVRLLGCRCAIGFDGAPIVAGDCVLYAAGKASRAA